MPNQVVTLHRWQILAVFAAVTVSFIVGLWFVVHLNNQRTHEIQRSRVESCKRTYEGVREVLRPFFPPPPRTPDQEKDLAKLNGTVDRLKANCGDQTQTKGER